MTLRAGDRLGPYEIQALLGAGGMGQVYRARDPRLDRGVAIKVILPAVASDADRLRRFEQEARSCGSLSHPNVLAVYDVGSRDGAPYLVTELLEGETLRQALGGGALSVRRALAIALQVARGLAAAHARGIVHRDLKPENLFLTTDGVAKILDFGLARLVRPADAAESGSAVTAATASGLVVGTAGYMSPEQVRGQEVDHRSDIFAFGSVLYEMLAGRRAFGGESAVDGLHAILYDDPPELPPVALVPPGLERVIRHCLEKKPEDRYQSTRDLAFELAGLAVSPGPAGLGAGATPPAGAAPNRRGRSFGLAAAAAGVLLLAALAAFFAGRRNVPPPSVPSFRPVTFRRGQVSSGRFTPDGRTVVYAARFEDAKAPEVFSVRADVPESRALGFAGDVVGVSSRDEIAILEGDRLDTLSRAPMAGGQPRPVATSVACADWAPDGANLALVRTVEGMTQVEYPPGKVLARPAPGEGGFGCPRFSPRGDRLAVGVADGYRIFDLATGRSSDVPGVTELWHEKWFSWSPDGGEIWFSSVAQTLEALSLSGRRRPLLRVAGNLSLYDVTRDGDVLFEHAFVRERVFVRAPGEAAERDLSVFDSSWLSDLSADGRYALVTERGSAVGGRSVVYLRRTDGSPPMRLAEDGMGVALSPDARWALVRPAMVPSPSKWSGLRVVPVGPGNERTIATPPGLVLGVGTWVSDDLVLVAGHQSDRKWHEYLVDVKKGAVRPFIEGETGACAPGPRSAACVVTDPPIRVELFPYAGGPSRVLRGFDATMIPRRLSSDERSVFSLVLPQDGNLSAPARIGRLEPDTLRREHLQEIRLADPAGVAMWYTYVTADGRGYGYNYMQALHTLYVTRGVR